MKNKMFLVIFILIGLIPNIFPQTLFRSGLFLPHSSGGVIWSSSSPDVPALMNAYNTAHGYTGNDAVTMDLGESFFPSLDNGGNFYDAWHAVFVGESDYPEEDLALQQYIQNNSIIIIKSCWGGSGIAPMGNPADTLIIDDDAVGSGGRTYYRTQWHWRNIVRIIEGHPDKFFVIWTGIPLVPGPSYDGTIAHNFFIWAKDTLATGNDPIFGDFPDNVYVFDAFHLLATPTENFSWGTAYWGMNPLYHDEGDNHPNETGDNVVAQPFVWETFDAAIAYEGIIASEVPEINSKVTTTYTLEQNYPNPFNPSTEINFTLAKSGNITFKVYDSLGSVVATLIDGFMESGKHSVKFNAKDFTSGIYFYRIKADNFTSTRKMLFIK